MKVKLELPTPSNSPQVNGRNIRAEPPLTRAYSRRPYGTIDATTTGGTAVTVTVIVAVADRPALFVPVSVITVRRRLQGRVIEGPLPITPSSEDLHTSAEAGSDPS
jgi:hypothetical protein